MVLTESPVVVIHLPLFVLRPPRCRAQFLPIERIEPRIPHQVSLPRRRVALRICDATLLRQEVHHMIGAGKRLAHNLALAGLRLAATRTLGIRAPSSSPFGFIFRL